VERHHPARARERTDELLDALAHLPRCFVRERDREDLGRLRADGGEQMRDAARQHARLAGACAGDHEQRPLGGQHRLQLGRIQVFQVRRGGAHGHRSRIAARLRALAGQVPGPDPPSGVTQ